MKLLELLPNLKSPMRLKRKNWSPFLIVPPCNSDPFLLIDLYSIQIDKYCLTYADLLADDWEIMQ